MTQTYPHPPASRPAQEAPLAIEQAQQYLTFMLGQEMFGLGILAVKEIIEYSNLTEVPTMPAYLRGVIDLRGAVVPVIDLAVRFGRQVIQPTRRTCIVIIEVPTQRQRRDIGIIVDAVNSVLELRNSDIEPPPNFGTNIRTEFIRGMGKISGRFVILLDVEHLLAVDHGALAGGIADRAIG